MRLAAAAFAPGLFASPILLGLFCWPFLIVWVLGAAKRPEEAGPLAWFGLGLSALALLGCSSQIGWGQAVCLGLESCVPVIVLSWRQDVPRPKQAAMEHYVPLLVTGCIFMALLLRPPLAALFFDTAGTVLLAWWDGRATRRAMPAWEIVRLRLGGVIMASVGLMVMRGGSVFTMAESAMQVGQVLALTGLCMMAGLGTIVSSRAELVLLDVGLRFVPLCLLPLVAASPLAWPLMTLAGLLALGSVALGRGGRLPFLPWMAGLGVIAAGVGQMLVLLLLYSAAWLAASLRVAYERLSTALVAQGGKALPSSGAVALPMQMVLPLLMVVVVVLAPLLGKGALGGLVLCLIVGLWEMELETLPYNMVLVWRGRDRLIKLVLVLLGALAIVGLVLLMMRVVPEPALLFMKERVT